MDPASLTGLIIALEQIIGQIFKFGNGVKAAKKEVNQLCSELFALKGSLEHIRMNFNNNKSFVEPDGALQSLFPPLLKTEECSRMFTATESLVVDLTKRLSPAPGRLNSMIQSLTWPLKKDDIRDFISRLERLKSYFLLATTSDNMYVRREHLSSFAIKRMNTVSSAGRFTFRYARYRDD